MKAGDASEVPATDYLLSAAPLMPRLAGYMQRQLDAERGVIAKELHDELGGFLVAAKMDVSHALRQLPQAPAEVRERLAQVQHSLDEAIALERRVVERLQPGLLMHVGLFSALRWYAEDMVARLGGSFRSKLPLDEVPLNLPTRVGLYRILQDALERAAGSSKSAIEVTAQVQANVLEMQVVHRALPLSATAAGEDDLRVLAMLQRATAIGGELSMGGDDAVTRLVVPALLEIYQLSTPWRRSPRPGTARASSGLSPRALPKKSVPPVVRRHALEHAIFDWITASTCPNIRHRRRYPGRPQCCWRWPGQSS